MGGDLSIPIQQTPEYARAAFRLYAKEHAGHHPLDMRRNHALAATTVVCECGWIIEITDSVFGPDEAVLEEMKVERPESSDPRR